MAKKSLYVLYKQQNPRSDCTLMQSDLGLVCLSINSTVFNDSVTGLQRLNIQANQTFVAYIQSTLVLSKSKGLSEILQDICTLTYQICRIEEIINQTTTFHK